MARDSSSIMTAIDLASYAGLAAMTLLTVNLMLGILMAVKYNPVREWPHRRISTFQLHNWTAYTALAVACVHPVILLFSDKVHFRILDLIYPLHSPKQPTINTLGAIALHALIFVVATSYFRRRVGRIWWKRLHYTAYAMAPVFYIHGILTDPELGDTPFHLDPLDGEKLYVELCLLFVSVAIVFRLRRHFRQPAPRMHRPKQPRPTRRPHHRSLGSTW
jgi:DMSO/TMAO reductase YedYZ heme-binding membrane subunit